MIFSLNGKTQVQMFGCVTHESGAWHRGRCVDTHLILYVAEGDVHMQIGKASYHATNGDILFIPAGTPYRPLEGGRCTYYVFHFLLDTLPDEGTSTPAIDTLEKTCTGFAYAFDTPTDCTLRLDKHYTPQNQSAVLDVLKRAALLDVTHDASLRILLELYFREFLILSATLKHQDTQTNDIVERILHYIHDHIKEPITLADIAEAFYLSESYIARIFKKAMNVTIGTYITKQKINLACAHLINTDLTISEIAEQVGFATPYYFSTTFSKWTGMTPSAYRKRR